MDCLYVQVYVYEIFSCNQLGFFHVTIWGFSCKYLQLFYLTVFNLQATFVFNFSKWFTLNSDGTDL